MTNGSDAGPAGLVRRIGYRQNLANGSTASDGYMRQVSNDIPPPSERAGITGHSKSQSFRTLAIRKSKHSMDEDMKENIVTPRTLKTKHAARYIGVSAWKLRNLVQAGEIPYIPGEGTSPWLFDIRDLDNWIERRKLTL